jgi:large exoprotein involved in heme utilization and adhesion
MDHSSIASSSAFADGGNITIKSTGSVLQVVSSQITTSVGQGRGTGGNIVLGSPAHPLGSMVLLDSTVSANAFGGLGGNIGVFADVFLRNNSPITASSARNLPGTIDVEARITDVSGSLAELPGDVLQAQNLPRGACASRTSEGNRSSLVVAAREGIPPQPDGLLSSPLTELLFDRASPSAESDDRLFMASAGVWVGSRCTK